VDGLQRREMNKVSCWGNQKGKHHFKDLSVVGKIRLKLMN
jgi:hypothetical protein